MKLNFYFCAALLLMTSCASQQDDAVDFFDKSETNVSSNRTIADAINIAKHAVTLLPTNSRSGVCVDENDVIVICNPTSSRSGQSDTLLYAVNNEDNKGFTLVAAPKNVEPIIAITEDGTFGSKESLDNDNFQFALAAAQQYVKDKREDTSVSQVALDSLGISDFFEKHLQSPRLNLKWGQSWPQNIYCPNSIAGCVPVAIGQICNYFSEPSQINLSFDERDKDTQTLNWTDIKRHILTDTTQCLHSAFILQPLSRGISGSVSITPRNCLASDSAHYAIGRFVRQLGVIAMCVYLPNATSTSADSAISALKRVLPDKDFTTTSTSSNGDNLYQYLKDDGVAMLIGSGHAWVADATGYVDYYIYKTNYDEGTNKTTITKTLDETKYYIHHNWGWDGNCNGYFLAGIFAPGKAYQYDDESTTNTSSSNFSNNVTFTYTK